MLDRWIVIFSVFLCINTPSPTHPQDAYQQAMNEANMLREQLRRQQMSSSMSSHSRSTLPAPRRVHVSGMTGWNDGMFTIPTNG